jgi:glycosyltransferase involved in cell wall biosynthesis
MTTPRRIAIVSTAHWEGDPRLNRHRAYLEAAGHRVSLITHRGVSRPLALLRSLVGIARTASDVVILPDPELYFLGSLAARLGGGLPVVDIHEDYPRAAMARPWIPKWARPLFRLGAAVAVWLGRSAAWRVMVAAPELAKEGDALVLNVPEPATLSPLPHDGTNRLVYIGDVTLARGALTMVETLGNLDESFVLQLIGRANTSTRDQIEAAARRFDVSSRLEVMGQIDHAEAWTLAQGALAGLNLLEPVPAYMEAVATKLWEYMAVGLPAVVTDLPGQARVISQVHPELVCSTPSEAAGTIRRLAAEPELRAALGERSRRLVEERWAANRPDLAVQSLVEP